MIKYNDYYSDEENIAISRLMVENGIKDFKEIEYIYYRGKLNLNGTDVENIRSLECIKDWDFVYEVEIEGCRHLKTIQLYNSVSDVSFMRNMKQVEVLDLINNHGLSDISALEGMLKMKRLELDQTDISDISAVRNMKDLEYISINETKVHDISPLEKLTKLKEIDMYGTPVEDISILANLPKIEVINAQKTNVEDVSSFIKTGKIKVLYIEKSKLPKPEKKDIPKEIGKLKTKIREKEIQLMQTINEEEIKEFEEKYKIELPENYKTFITKIGDGWKKIKINGEQIKDCRRFKECRYDEKGVSRKFKYTESWIWEDDEDATDRKINIVQPIHNIFYKYHIWSFM